MRGTDWLHDAVAGLLRESAERDILPRFRALSSGDVREKEPDELVTTADEDAEERLTRGLARLLPGVPVLGEEAAARDGFARHSTREGQLWLVDPLDGTSEFVAGRPEFALMVALLRDGVPVLAWILAPQAGWLASAEHGAGALLDGTRLRVPDAHPDTQLTGSLRSRFFPPGIRERLQQRAGAFDAVAIRGSSGWDHVGVASGRLHFALYQRTLPWDHAPGSLIVREAGGVALRLDGSPFLPLEDRSGLLSASRPAIWTQVRDALVPEYALNNDRQDASPARVR